jgi:hypothetical protein
MSDVLAGNADSATPDVRRNDGCGRAAFGGERPSVQRPLPAGGRVRVDGHFSTPVTTTPRMNARWARKNTTTGTAIVMSDAAWIRVGCVEYRAL